MSTTTESGTGPYRSAVFPASRLVAPPLNARRVASLIAAAFVVFFVVALIAPWQQSVSGRGRVISYAPLERRQSIEAPVDGRVARFHVREGSHVEEGDVLVDLTGVDPMLLARIEAEREVTLERVASYEGRVASLLTRVDSVRSSQQQAVRAAEARVRVAQERIEAASQSVTASEASYDTAALQLARQRALGGEGLISQRDLELSLLSEARARTSREAARATERSARADLEAARASLEQARANMLAEIDNATASLRSAETDLQSARASLLRLDSRLAQQSSQRVVAPRAGTVLRLMGFSGGEQVRAGDALLVLVPDTTDRAVEILVDGNDASLIQPGRAVRLQFEGWPAVQFTGWPSVAVGTFGGRVAFVDATDDGAGDFRVVVVPDDDDEPWPSTRFLRQGVRANGWVLLDEVRLGYELWRQFNGFPPATTMPSPDAGGGSYGGGSYGGGSYGGGDYAGDEGGY